MTRWPRAESLGREAAGVAAGAAGAFLVAAMLAPLRDHVQNANVALLLVLPVLAAAVIGGRWPARAARS